MSGMIEDAGPEPEPAEDGCKVDCDFVLRFRPQRDERRRPAIVRLRWLLKYALRACRLRCVEMREVRP